MYFLTGCELISLDSKMITTGRVDKEVVSIVHTHTLSLSNQSGCTSRCSDPRKILSCRYAYVYTGKLSLPQTEFQIEIYGGIILILSAYSKELLRNKRRTYDARFLLQTKEKVEGNFTMAGCKLGSDGSSVSLSVYM